MNAATVSGPRSRIRSLIFLDGDEDFTFTAPQEDSRDPTRRDFLELVARILRSGHGPAVHRENHVVLTDRAGRWTVRIDIADERAGPAVRDLQAPRDRRRQIAQGDPEPAAGL